ncbi:MAG: dTMP kinase [Sphingopyxis sp.]
MTHKQRGKFITLEGGEGVGKSTQMGLLAAALRAHGLTIVVTREPGGSPGAEAIRELLLHMNADAWSPQTEALLFAAARSDHVTRVIAPALERGDWVLCDRFIDSSRAYQGGGGALSDTDIMTLHTIGCGGLLPDRTLLLKTENHVANARRGQRQLEKPDRFEARQASFHTQVAAAFDAMAKQEPSRFHVINADASPGEVTARLMAALIDILPC